MKRLLSLKKLLMVAVTLSVVFLINISKKDNTVQTRHGEKPINLNFGSLNNKTKYMVLYYNPPLFISKNRKDAMSCGFDECKWNNCKMTLDKNNVYKSDAVIFNGILIPRNINFKRPYGQVWIFAAHESPLKYDMGGNWWYKSNYIFNWTMTYNEDNTDIFLPYGEIRKRHDEVKRDFEAIASKKSNIPLMIASNCYTPSKRNEYVKELKRYMNVRILGKCGKTWKCGEHYRHDDDCFQILNTTYKYYLAFENAFCHNYYSEKFFENFNYDTIMITRGGLLGDVKKSFPEGIYIATENFPSVKDLAMYLKNLSSYGYAQMLRKKSQFYSTGFKPVYQRALCDLCYRMNFQKKYEKTIKNIKQWAFESKPCLDQNDVTDIR